MIDTFFKNIHISNFKSLKDVTLSDCKRINLLIGKPNVGKSNILEAIGLFSLPYLKYNKSKKITQFVRLENIPELFFNGNNGLKTDIQADNYSCIIEFLNEYTALSISSEKNVFEAKLESDLNLKIQPKSNLVSPVKYYKFSNNPNLSKSEHKDIFNISLNIPDGSNLLDTILDYIELKKEIFNLFSDYDLKILFDKGTNTLRIMKEIKEGEIFSLPYSSIADTLQRVIFFKTAIASNENSILLFEEPEAHCFPPYIAHFTQDVLNSETNQFFIATHSPYVLNDFLENQRDEVAIFMADFKDGQTVIYRLTDDEVNEVYNDGIDVFFNYEKYTQHG